MRAVLRRFRLPVGRADVEDFSAGDSRSARSRSVELPRPTLFPGEPNGLYFSSSICHSSVIIIMTNNSSHYSYPFGRDPVGRTRSGISRLFVSISDTSRYLF